MYLVSEARLAQRLATEHGAAGIFMTQSGEALAREDPIALEVFMHAAAQLTKSGWGGKQRENYDRIGAGGLSHVYALPGYEDKCVKVVAPDTHRYARGRSDIESPRLPNIDTEVRFMDRVGKHLRQQPGTRVKTPTQFAAARFRFGSVSLQERVPSNYASINDLIDEANKAGVRTLGLDEQAILAYKRASLALKSSLLRFGVSDMHDEDHYVCTGNFLIDRELLASGDIYIIDLIGRGRFHEIGARVLSRFS